MFVKNDKSGALYMKWIGKRFSGRELIWKPSWNNNESWVKEGGALSFSAASIGLLSEAAKIDNRRPVDKRSIGAFVGEILDRAKTGQIIPTADGKGLMIEKTNQESLTVTFGENALPRQIEIRDSGGKLLEQIAISDLKTNVTLTDSDFDPYNKEYGFPGYSTDGIFIDPEKMNNSLNANWAEIKDYTCVLLKQERVRGSLQKQATIFLKYRKPFDLYMKWIKDPHLGRELIYRQGKDAGLVVHEGGAIMGMATVTLDLDHRLVKRDTNHRITDLDIGFSLKTIHDNLYKGLKEGDVKIKFKGVTFISGRKVVLVESWFSNMEAKGYYSPHSIMGHDTQTGLPIKIVNFTNSGEVQEEFIWTKIKFNPGLTDSDFDRQNAEYHF